MRRAGQLAEQLPTLVEGGLIRTEKWAHDRNIVAKHPHSRPLFGDHVHGAGVAGVGPWPERRTKCGGRSKCSPPDFHFRDGSCVF